MKHKHFLFGKASLLLASFAFAAVSGRAATVTFSTGGVNCPGGLCSSVAGATTIDFESATTSPYIVGIATYSYSGSAESPFVTGTVPSDYTAPPLDDTQYLTVGSPNRPISVAIDFSAPINYFGVYLGSSDPYNSFAFFQTADAANPIAVFTADQLIPTGVSVGHFINFQVLGGAIERILLSSPQAAFESDNHAYSAVPEPSSFALAGIGTVLWAVRRFRITSKK